MKVLHILTDTNIGGAGIWLLNFLKSYDRKKTQVSVVLPKNAKLKEEVEKLDVAVIEADNIADESFSFGGIKSFLKILKDEKPDIIHTHACMSARIAGRLRRVKIVNTRHCLEDRKSFPKNIIYKFVNNVLSDSVIGVSKSVVDNLIQDGINKRKVWLVYNGITPLNSITADRKIEIRKKYGFSENDIIVGIVARLEEVKNHKLFLQSAKIASEQEEKLRFLIVGTGSLEAELKNMAKDLGILDKVVFAGYIKDVTDITNIIDISVISSDKEALSIALLEAMSLEKPCIATDSGGPSEIIEDGKNGFIVPCGDFEKMSSSILKLSEDESIRKKLGQEGKKTVTEKFKIDEMARKIEEIYSELVNREDKTNENDK